MHWNVRGIIGDTNTISQFLVDNDISVFCANETFLHPHHLDEVKLNGYEHVAWAIRETNPRFAHKTRGGGASIFVKTGHAEMMKFPCKKKRLCVRTLGGEEREIDRRICEYQIKALIIRMRS